MKGMKVVFAVGVVLVSVGAQAADLTPQRVAKIAKKVYREMRLQEPSIDGPTNVDHATTADYAPTAGRAATAGHADSAGRADRVDHATTAESATNAQVAEVAGSAESANPMAYAYVRQDGIRRSGAFVWDHRRGQCSHKHLRD